MKLAFLITLWKFAIWVNEGATDITSFALNEQVQIFMVILSVIYVRDERIFKAWFAFP